MSLEAEIIKLTTAITVLTEVMTSGGVPVVNGKANPSSKVPAPKADTAGAETADAKAGAKAAPKAAAKTAPATKPAPTDDYAPVKQAILDAIAAGHRKSITDMLAEYDAVKGTDLSPEVYPEVLEKISVIMGVNEGELA